MHFLVKRIQTMYPLPSHKDHISVTLKWKYYCILHLDSSIFLQCFVHALLKRQTVLLSNKLHSRLKHSIVLPVMDYRLADLHLPTLGCSYRLHFKPCQDPVADLGLPRYTVIHVSNISYPTKMWTKKGWWRHFPCHWTCWHPCSLGCLLRHDCSHFSSDVV